MILIMSLFLGTASAECPKYEKFVDITSETLAFTLSCKNYVSLRNDVDKLGRSIGFCPEDKGMGCSLVAKAGVYLVGKQIPHYWKCTPDISMTVLERTLTKVCERYTPY